MTHSLVELVLILIAGLVLILFGANYMTDGSAAIARRFNISGFVIGLTVVAIGTSMPEMVVSIVSALKGSTDIAIGNVSGSNIFNTLVILGMCAAVRPIMLTQQNIYRDIPMCIVASLVFVVVTLSGSIDRLEGILMFAAYIVMMLYSIFKSKPSIEEVELEKQIEEQPLMPMWLSLLMTIGGLGALIWGGNLFIDSAVQIAYFYNIPDNVIAVTLVAGGTSLPEFAASLVSLIKGKSDIALGNVIGSNIANILLVLGFSSSIMPLTMGTISIIDVLIVLIAAILLFLTAFTFGKRRIDRVEGILMIAIFVGYMSWVLTKAPAAI
ncbi:MAG: calcium/sodium antiporter [Rikenellaceae bacterium]